MKPKDFKGEDFNTKEWLDEMMKDEEFKDAFFKRVAEKHREKHNGNIIHPTQGESDTDELFERFVSDAGNSGILITDENYAEKLTWGYTVAWLEGEKRKGWINQDFKYYDYCPSCTMMMVAQVVEQFQDMMKVGFTPDKFN